MIEHHHKIHEQRKELFDKGTFALRIEKEFVSLLAGNQFLGLWARGDWNRYDDVISAVINTWNAIKGGNLK